MLRFKGPSAERKLVVSSELSQRQLICVYLLITSLFFTAGFTYGLLDSLNKHFQIVFGITKTQSTFMQVSYFGSFFIFAPWAGVILTKIGYKNGILIGLVLYSLGALFYWPVAVKRSFPGFVICTFFIGMGLSFIEVAANNYIIVLADPKRGAARLSFSQAWATIGTFVGVLAASQDFFKGANETSLKNVQWVYLAVACFGGTLILLFRLATLPEIDESKLPDTLYNQTDVAPLHKQYHLIFGFWAQFCYIGANVAVGSLSINLFTDAASVAFSPSKASLWYSYCQILFVFGRFVSSLVLKYVHTAHALTFFILACCLFTIGIILGHGTAVITSLFFVHFFASICWPAIYGLAISRLGHLTKVGGSIVVAGLGGGALFPPLQALLADRTNIQFGFWVAFTGYANVLAYAVGMCIDKERRRNIDAKTGKRLEEPCDPSSAEEQKVAANFES